MSDFIPVREAGGPAPKPTVKRRYVKRSKKTRTARDTARPTSHSSQMDEPEQRAAPVRAAAGDEPLRRVTRDEREVNRFDIPRHLLKPGWDVQWVAVLVVNQPVDGATLREAYDGGWRPERAKDWPTHVAPGTPPDAAVEQYGFRLYGRPSRFTMEAKQEDYDRATRQLSDRAHGAQEGRLQRRDEEGLADMGKVVRAIPLGVTIEGEVGSTARR